MSIREYTINLDLKQNLNLFTNCKQFDNLKIIFTIYDNSIQSDLDNYDVRLKAIKSDKVPLIQEHMGIDINGNIVTIECDEQLTTTAGKVPIELQFKNKTDSKKKATFNLILKVFPTTVNIENTISKATYTLLEELENKLDQASDFFENIGNATEINTTLRETISIGSSTDSTLKQTIQNANTTNSKLENQNSQAITNKNKLDSANEQAVTNKNKLDSANEQAVKNYNALESLGDATDLAKKVEQNTSQLNANTNNIRKNIPTFGFNGITVRNYTKGLLYTDYYRSKFLDVVKEIGADSISVVFNSYQSNVYSTDIEYLKEDNTDRWWTTYKEIYDYCKFLKENGFKVMLKPHVEPREIGIENPTGDYVPRDRIKPTNVSEWFENYTNFLLPYVKMAEELKLDIFCIGCEYKGLTVIENDSYWENVINSVRENFNGLVTYASYYEVEFFDEADWITWWDKLDIIGVDFYRQRSTDFTDQNECLQRLYDNDSHYNTIASILNLSNKFNKPIMFTEYNSTASTDDYKKVWYETVLNEFKKNTCFKGCFIWEYNVESMIEHTINSNTPKTKEIIRKYYTRKSEPYENNMLQYIPQNSGEEYWFNFADIELTREYSKLNAKFYFEDNTSSVYKTQRGYVNVDLSYTNTFNVYCNIDSNSTLDENNFGYTIKGKLIKLYVKVAKYDSYCYKIDKSCKTDLIKLKYYTINNQKNMNADTPQANFKKNDLARGFMFCNLAYEGSMTNGEINIDLELPYEFTFIAYAGVNTRTVNDDNCNNVIANLQYINNKSIRLTARHISGSGSYFCKFQMLIFGQRK